MSIIDAVKGGFAQSGKLLKVVLIFFILNTVMGLISLPLASPDNVGNPGVAAISLVLSVIFFAIFIFLQGGALGLVKDLQKTGSYQMSNFPVYGKKFYVRILGLLSLYILVAVAVVLVLGLIGSGIMALANNIVTRTLVGVVAGIAALIAIVILLFPIYTIIVDDTGVIASLKKGVKVGRENFWNILGLFAVLVVISVLISLVIGFIIGLVTVPLPFTLTQVIITVVNSAVQSYIPIVMMLALMSFYLGLTKKGEGLQSSPSA